MKLEWLAVVLLCALALRGGAAEEFRIFTAKDGVVVSARVVEYDAKTKRARLARRGGKKAWVAVGSLSEEDQRHILDWADGIRVFSKEELRVGLTKKKGAKSGFKSAPKESGTPGNLQKVDKIHFDLKANNRSTTPLRVSRIEFRYYLDGDIIEDGKGQDRELFGIINGGLIEPSRSKVFAIPAVDIRTNFMETRDVSYSANEIYTDVSKSKTAKEELLGVWIRLHSPEVDGRSTVIDVTYPNDLPKKVEWKPLPKSARKKTR